MPAIVRIKRAGPARIDADNRAPVSTGNARKPRDLKNLLYLFGPSI